MNVISKLKITPCTNQPKTSFIYGKYTVAPVLNNHLYAIKNALKRQVLPQEKSWTAKTCHLPLKTIIQLATAT